MTYVCIQENFINDIKVGKYILNRAQKVHSKRKY